MDIAPYDMTERLKEVNRALLEDPTPAECDRAITIRFRDVIADYQSPREYYPSGESPLKIWFSLVAKNSFSVVVF